MDVDEKRAGDSHVYDGGGHLGAFGGTTDASPGACGAQRETPTVTTVDEPEQGSAGDEPSRGHRGCLGGGRKRTSKPAPRDRRREHARAGKLPWEHRHGVENLVVVGLESLVVVRLAHT
jgi:hypothetical protein